MEASCPLIRSTPALWTEGEDPIQTFMLDDHVEWALVHPTQTSNNTVPWATPANTNSLLPVSFAVQQAVVDTWSLVRGCCFGGNYHCVQPGKASCGGLSGAGPQLCDYKGPAFSHQGRLYCTFYA